MADQLPDRPKSRSLKPLRALWPYLRVYKKTLALRSRRAAGCVRRDARAADRVSQRHRSGHGGAGSLDDRSVLRRLSRCRGRLRRVRGVALLSRDLARRARRRGSALRISIARVIRMDPTFFEVTRTGEVLSRLTTDTTLVQSIAGVNLSITLRSTMQLVGALALLIATSPSLAGMILLLIPLVIVAAHRRRPEAAHAVASVAGSRRRHERTRRRDAQRHSDRAGLHARATAQRALQPRLSRIPSWSRCAAHACAHADRGRHDDDLRRGHVRALAGRASRARGTK